MIHKDDKSVEFLPDYRHFLSLGQAVFPPGVELGGYEQENRSMGS